MNSVMRPGIVLALTATRVDRTAPINMPSRSWWLSLPPRSRVAGHRADRSSPDYIDSWLQVLREDNRAIVRAASQASKAADYLFSFVPDLARAAAAEAAIDDQEVAQFPI